MMKLVLVSLPVVLGLVPARAAPEAAGLVVEDIFGRRIEEAGLVLVDWEGYLANPAIKLYLSPAAGARLPATALLEAREPRLHFNLPSQTGPRGPRKEVTFERREKVPVLISIFPDRDGRDESHELEVGYRDAAGAREALRLPVRVVDQDRAPPPAVFPLQVDFSQDRTGFFQDAGRRAVVEEALRDWAFFLEDLDLDPVPAGSERTFIWDVEGFERGRYVFNSRGYRGYLLYAYGIQSGELRSGGEPSRDGGFQSGRGEALPLKRSGGLEVEVRGNYNERGWLVGVEDGEWWRCTNLRDVENDLYSIAHHEIGHALFFNPSQPLFGKAKGRGKLEDAEVRSYLVREPAIDRADHFPGTVDPRSGRGAFGFEYHGEMPLGRWLITRSDLLCARAVGYRLRATSAFTPLSLSTGDLPRGTVSRSYSGKLRAAGGIPFYDFEVAGGALPDGLRLDPFSGEIAGTPREAGSFEITVRVRDYQEGPPGVSGRFRIEVREE